MRSRSFIIKVAILLTSLTVELIYLRDFTGLVFLTTLFGGVLLWKTIYFVRYFLFLIISAIILFPSAYVLHSHFYDWQKEAKKPMLHQLSNVIEDIVLTSSQQKLKITIDRIFSNTNKRYERYHVKITTPDGTVIIPTKEMKQLEGSNVTKLTTQSHLKHVEITYAKKHRNYWGWQGTYISYWRALLKAEIIFNDPPKYRDYSMLHLVILLVVINVYLQLNFRRNYLRSKYLMEQLSQIAKDKKTV